MYFLFLDLIYSDSQGKQYAQILGKLPNNGIGHVELTDNNDL